MDETQGPPKRQSTFPLYSKYFGTHPQDVVDHVGFMKKQMEDFVDAFRKRIDVEMTYSKNLTQVSKALDKYIRPGTQLASSFICSAFKVQHEMRSRQAFDLAESIKTQIESICVEMVKKQTALHKKLAGDVKRFYKEANSVDDEHRETLSRFEGINREMEEMIITKNIMKYTTGIPQQKKVKMISKTMESIKQNKQYEKLYVQSVRNYNKFVGAYNTQIINQLDQAETQVRQQCVLQADCIRKLIVAEASLFKNIEYDIVNISTQMQGLDLQKDAQAFVEQFKDNNTNRLLSEDKAEEENKRNSITESNQYLIQSKKIVGKSMLSNSLLYVDEEYFSWMLFNKRNKKLRDIVAGIWKELNQRQSKQIQENDKPNSKIEEPPKEEASPENTDKNEESDKKEETTEQTNENKQTQNSEQTLAKQDWSKQLRQLIQTFKVQHPPTIVSAEIEKKPPVLTVEAVFSAFMEIMRTISELWNVDQFEPQLVNSKIETLEKYLSEHHLYRLIAMIFIEEYRLQLQVMIKNGSCAKMCSKVLKSIIKESQKQNDTFIIRGILGLVFTFYWNDEKYKKLIYLNPQVYQCQVWKKYDFWQAAIFENTYEQMALFTKQKGQTQAETILRQKNIIFSQLASFCHYMVMLGITSKRVRLIVGRYCRLYEMTEQQNKDLSKMITNTTKQYKQTAFQFSLKTSDKQKSVTGD